MSDLTDKIRSRSVWQVLALYLGGAFVALQIVEQVVESAGLPDWVRTYCLVLLILCLPIVVATAAIQSRRVATSEVGREVASDPSDGPSTEPPSHEALSAPRRWFNWRNTALAGLGGFLIISLSTAAYLVMRAAGIGPMGTLEAQGSLADGARVVLAEFQSADPELGSVVTNTLRIDLLQSPFLHVLEPSELAEALTRMELEPGTVITPEIARELAIRDGFDAVIEGEVGPAGDGYVLTARVVGGADWTSLAAFRNAARAGDDLIDAIEDLSRDIRDKSGESLRSVRSGPPLRAVTTSFLEALQAYNRGIEAFTVGEHEAAVEWYERAIAIDPEFAMAHRRLSAGLGILGIRRADQIAAATRAYELRDRLTELERLLAEAHYYATVIADNPAAIRAYEAMIELAPTADVTRNARQNLAVQYRFMGRYEEAERLLVDNLAVRPYQFGVNALTSTRIALGDIDGAQAALDEGSEALPESANYFENRRVALTVALDDIPLARDLAAGFAERYPGHRDGRSRSYQTYLINASEGRLEAAAGAIDGFVSGPVQRSLLRARLQATQGDSVGAVRVLLEGWEAAWDSDPLDRAYGLTLRELVRFGELVQAEEVLAEWRREVPAELLGFPGRVARLEIEAELALARGSIDESIGRWESLEQACPICSDAASYGLGRAHESAGDAARAIAEYERHLTTWHQYNRDPFFRADVLGRLARLHDEAGSSDEAASYYRLIIDRWRDADASLQPQVRAAQARVDELR